MFASLVVAILLLFGASASAQQPWRAVFNGFSLQSARVLPDFPTNISGMLSWYVASDYTTNSGTATLPDRGSHSFALTNVAGSACLLSGTLNGQKTVYSDGTLRTIGSQSYTSPQPHEVVMLLCVTNNQAPSSYAVAFDSYDATHRNSLMENNTTYAGWLLNAGSAAQTTTGRYSNYWYVVDAIFDGTLSRIYTNGQLLASGLNPGSGNASGLRLFVAFAGNNYYNSEALAEMVTYQSTNSNADRATLFNYLTNKYLVSP